MLFASPITSHCLQTFSTKTEFQIEGYTTISNHDNNARTPTHCNNRNLESNDISVQTAPRRHSSYPTSMRSACGIERAGRSFPFDSRARMDKPTQTSMRSACGIERADIDRFPFDSRARMDKAATNGYNDSPHTLRCKRSLQGFTTEPIPCPVEETPDEFPIKARSSSYEQRNPITLFEMPIVVAEHDLTRRTGRTPQIFGPFFRLPFSAAPDSPHVPPQFSNPKTDTT